MLTCTRCHEPIVNGQALVLYNKPKPGSPYHKACPNGAVPESQAAAAKAPATASMSAPVAHQGPLTPEAMALIVASVTAALAAQRPAQAEPPAPVIPEPPVAATATSDDDEADEDAPTVRQRCECCGQWEEECPGCDSVDYLITKGYEPMGFNCAGRAWLAPRDLADAQRFILRHLDTDAYRNGNGTTPITGAGDWALLFADAAEGLDASDLRKLHVWYEGVREGIRAVRTSLTHEARMARLATMTDAQRYRDRVQGGIQPDGALSVTQGHIPLTALVDDDEAAREWAIQHPTPAADAATPDEE